MKPLKYEHIALICVSLGWFLVLSGRLSISTLLVTIENALGIGHFEAGIALSSMWLFYGLMQYPSGIFSDIKGRKKSILYAMLIFSIAYFAIGISMHYLLFLGSLILVGIGCGSYPTVGIAMLTDIFKTQRGKALGIQSSAGSLAGAVPIFASAFALLYDWRLFFIIWGGFSVISTVFFARYTGESTTLPNQVSLRERIIDGFRVFRNHTVIIIFIVNLILAATWIGYMSFYPTYLIETKYLSGLIASILFAILISGGLLFKPLIGSLSDKYNKIHILLILVVLTAVSTALLIVADSVYALLLISFMLSLTSGAFPVFSSYIMGLYEEKGRGGKLGLYRSLTILLGSPTAAAIGFSSTTYGFDIAFWAVVVMLAVAAVILSVLVLFQRAKPRREE